MKLLMSVLAVLWGCQVWAWGPEGHMIVAQLAENQLTTSAKAKVQKLLQGQSLASVSNWADSIKGQAEWAMTKSWHFVDVPDGGSYEEVPHAEEGDVIVAITSMITTLKKPGASPQDQQNALKFLIHFVGDIHQPLHVGRPSDRGGNDIKVVFEGRNQNLHSLWDSGLISISHMDYVQYTQYLESLRAWGLAPAPYDLKEVPFSTIISEDMNAREAIYNFGSHGNGPIVLNRDYLTRNQTVLNTHLLKGGKRLAAILNQIYQ